MMLGNIHAQLGIIEKQQAALGNDFAALNNRLGGMETTQRAMKVSMDEILDYVRSVRS